jgi:hypothetical protein
MGTPPVDIVDRVRMFEATDRCDQCGSQAYAASYHGTSELLWCVHHYRDHADALAAKATLVIIDVTAIKNLTR